MQKMVKVVVMGTLLFGSTCNYASESQDPSVTVTVTASTLVSNVPNDFKTEKFALLRPWELDTPPSFDISATPTTDQLTVNPLNNLAAFSIVDSVPPNKGLTWYYYCDGLQFNYAGSETKTATVVFSGTIDPGNPGSGVQCTCSGSACSTTATVPARLVMR